MKAATLLALALAGCQSAAIPPGPVTGSWGGDHIGLTLDAGGGRADYDCAAGTIEGPLLADPTGRFRAVGTHSPGQGGPARIGDEPPRLPAIYAGRVDGDRMTITVQVPSRGIEIGPLALRRGAAPNLLRCL